MVDLPLQIIGEQIPQPWMRLDKPGNVAEVFDPLTLPSFGIAPGPDLSFEGVVQRGDPEQNAMHIRRPGSLRKVAVKIFGAQLEADFGMSLEVDRPRKVFGAEARCFEGAHGPVNRLGGDHKSNVLRDHRLCGPMIDRDAPDGAPRDAGPPQTIHQLHDIIRAAGRLPVVECFRGHTGVL